jgi:hypothetical protein
MNNKKTGPAGKPDTDTGIDFHGAALIDEQGREIPITDEMVRAALDHAVSTGSDSKDG